MANKIHERRAARESALALLYSGDISEKGVSDILHKGAYPAADLMMSDYAELLIEGVGEHMAEIDARLESTSENWALGRMPVVDRAILRLAIFEMFYVDDVPVSVAINEAVELAKAYGGEDDSSRFVNGVLGRIARGEEGEAQAGAQEGEAQVEGGLAEGTPAEDAQTEGESAEEAPAEEAPAEEAPTEETQAGDAPSEAEGTQPATTEGACDTPEAADGR